MRNQPTRRAVLRSAALLGSPLLSQDRAACAYVGCYTTPQRYARGDGIHVYRMDSETGAWSHLQRLGDLVNPSFLAMRPGRRCLYAAHGDQSYASAFSVDPRTGQLAPLNRVQTAGRNGVHLAADPAGRFVALANYATGNVALLPIRPDGGLDDPAQVVALEGPPGPHRVEQASSHPHQALFDPSGRFLVVPDKGLDRVFVFRFDNGRLSPTAQGAAVARPGSGPRHAAFHPSLPVLWVLNEIASSVTTYYWDAERGHLRPAQVLPSLPPDYTGENTAAEIAVSRNGRFLYCSNRGHDSVAIFAADPATALLSWIGCVPSRGRTPRYIGFDPSGRFLYAANEQSDTISCWRADPATGQLSPGPVTKHASPVVIAF